MRKCFYVLVAISLLGYFLLCDACGKSIEKQISEQLELGQRYLMEENYEEAVVAFQKVIELDEKEIRAYTGLIQVYQKTENVENIESIIQQGIALQSEDDEIGMDERLELLAAAKDYYAQTGNLENLINVLDILRELEPENTNYDAELSNIYVELANRYVNDENLGEGIFILNQAAKIRLTNDISARIEELHDLHCEELNSFLKETYSSDFTGGQWGSSYTDYDRDGYFEIFAYTKKNNTNTDTVNVYYCNSDKSKCINVDNFGVPSESQIMLNGMVSKNPVYFCFAYGINGYCTGYYLFGLSDGNPELIEYDTEINIPENEIKEYIETNVVGSRETE